MRNAELEGWDEYSIYGFSLYMEVEGVGARAARPPNLRVQSRESYCDCCHNVSWFLIAAHDPFGSLPVTLTPCGKNRSASCKQGVRDEFWEIRWKYKFTWQN